jgi:hypothetical protein
MDEDRLMTKRHLHGAEQLVASGLQLIVEQNRIVQELRESGSDTTGAEKVLNTLLEAEALHEEYRDWLRYQLEAVTRARRTRFDTQPYKAVALALSVGWLLGRSHCPL